MTNILSLDMMFLDDMDLLDVRTGQRKKGDHSDFVI